MRLTPQQYQILAGVKRGPMGTDFLNLLQAMLDESDIGLRTATGEKVGWRQGESQCLVQLLTDFANADTLGKPDPAHR